MFDHKLIASTIVAIVSISILKQEWTFQHLHYSTNDRRFRTPKAYIIIYKDAIFVGLVVAVVFFVLPADFYVRYRAM